MITEPDRKVLILTRDFPPYYHSPGGFIRILKLAEYLDQQGIKVFIIAAKGEVIDYFGYEDLLSRLDVRYVSDPYQRLLNRRANRNRRQKDSNPSNRSAMTLVRRIVKELFVPDAGIIFVWRYYKAVLDLVTHEGIGNIIVSSPPHSMQLVGVLIKQKLDKNINLITDYRDGWNCRASFRKKTPLYAWLNRLLEKEVLKQSDHFTYVSEPIREKTERLFPNTIKHAVLMMNGFDPGMIPGDKTETPVNRYLTIGHFGPINDAPDSIRNPTQLFNAILKSGLDVKLIFYGDASFDKRWFRKFGDMLEIRDTVPHKQAIREMQEMDLLLFLHTCEQDSDEVISGKIFDYMLAQRPILCFGPQNMAASDIVRNYGLGYSIDINSETAVKDSFTDIYSDWQSSNLPGYDIKDLSEFNRYSQYARIVKNIYLTNTYET